MRTLLNGTFAFLLAGFASGRQRIAVDARPAQMRSEFAPLHLGGSPPHRHRALNRTGHHVEEDLLVLLFAMAAGLTASGIAANRYRILVRKAESRPERALYYAVMVIAGPSVLFENATRSFRTKACSAMAYGFAVAITGYWSFALGLLVLSICLHIRERYHKR